MWSPRDIREKAHENVWSSFGKSMGNWKMQREGLWESWFKKRNHLPRVLKRSEDTGPGVCGQAGLLWAQSSFVFSDIYLSLGREKTTKEVWPQGPNWHLNPAWLVIRMSVFFLKQEVFLNWVLSRISRVHFISKTGGHCQSSCFIALSKCFYG